MQTIKKIFIELVGLFVEDGRFAIVILIWLGIVWILAHRMAIRTDAGGLILFSGLALILIENTVRTSPSVLTRRLAKENGLFPAIA